MIGTVIVAAAIAIVQLDALKTGKPSAFAAALSTVALPLQSAVNTGLVAVRTAVLGLGALPHLASENRDLALRARALEAENARLREALARAPQAQAIAEAAARAPGGIVATTIGYDPENLSRTIAIDRGERAGVRLDDGVIDDDGAVGRVVHVEPFESTVLLITDAASKVPAVVQRGRWWGIATGTGARVALQYISQDAKLRVGDRVVTGEGRSFHAGVALGRIARIAHPEGALYQAATLEPAVAFGRLGSVIVLAH